MRVYIAGPYGKRTGNSIQECENRVDQAINAGRELIKKGHTPFIPHLYHYIHKNWKESPEEFKWWQICAQWIQFCDVLLRLSGDSVGSDMEINVAKGLGIPVYYSIEDIENV